MLHLPSGITAFDSGAFGSTTIEDKSGGINSFLSDGGDHRSDYIANNYHSLASTSISTSRSTHDSTTINCRFGEICPHCPLLPF